MEAVVTFKGTPSDLALLQQALRSLAAVSHEQAADGSRSPSARHASRQTEAQALELLAKVS